MKAGRILARARLYAGDMQGARYSDYEVYAAINDAVRVLAQEQMRTAAGTDFRRACELDTSTAGYALLPEGFLKEVRAFDGTDGNELLQVHTDDPGDGEYAVGGGVLHSGCSSVTLCYYGLPAEVRAPEDDLRISESMFQAVARTAATLLGGGSDSVRAAQYFTGQSASPSSNDGKRSGGEQYDADRDGH